MIISSRTKIRLSRNLTAQTTPYPHVKSWIKRGFLVLTIVMIAGVYLAARPNKNTGPFQTDDKEILGEQNLSIAGEAAEIQTYTIKTGDTLFNVSQKYEISWQTLAQINNLREPYILKVGQKLKIPRL
ncbi:MAG: hypothetical protein A2751_01510 [Candidatus Doudnabacteria bacterium RIFCSPHIGHO2_01_FULL_46_14]|uniref:LysM domain-containing protein n=1 Tax=Candidatus Doudnabacteria bacterium RIFCSPHIGHO2_01_FULL_46_14 TaxID=1817824 RepID=A0A1F5NP69_9BACT|nr:MAG: hypothetical protein A2751_01510 [Candidatus Doudnabacteria bacterium RIFCSPHIGHO2_01_FULL_46_14]